MFHLRAPNGLLMVEQKYHDNLTGGCCWTDPIRPSVQPAVFKDREDVRSRTEKQFPLIWRWFNSGEIREKQIR